MNIPKVGCTGNLSFVRVPSAVAAFTGQHCIMLGQAIREKEDLSTGRPAGGGRPSLDRRSIASLDQLGL